MDFLLKLLPAGQGSYIVMMGALLTAWGAFFTGNMTLQEAVTATFAALGFGTYRRAMKPPS